MTLDLTLPSKRGTTPQERAMYATIAMYGVKYNDYVSFQQADMPFPCC